jgi:molybdopterin-guanine dinucleotide biosynthesis protein A
MKRYRQVAAFILAGGSSSRMGRDKGLLEIGGAPLVVRTARLLEPLVLGVTVAGSPHLYRPLNLAAVEDHDARGPGSEEARCGPLAGIATALSITRAPWNLIVACDLPYLTREWVDWLLSRAIGSRRSAVIPQTARGLEPLAAVYRRECAASIREAIARGGRKVADVVTQLGVEFVFESEWRCVDPHGRVLENMNAPEDYAKALEWWGAEGRVDPAPARSLGAASERTASAGGSFKQ